MPLQDVITIILLLALVFVGSYHVVQRRRWRRRLEQGIVLPDTLPTGDTLPSLEARFKEAVGSDLLGRRLARIYAVLFDPDLIDDYVDDPYLVRQLEAHALDNNTALFLCAGAVEESVDGRVFRNDPANTLGAYLRSEFRKRDWRWPKHPYAWKQYFLEEHVGELF